MSGDTPIEPREYVHGNKVVDIGGHRLSRGKAFRNNKCRHTNLSYDIDERRVYCHDCESTVESFDAFMMLVNTFSSATRKLEHQIEEVRQAKEHAIISRAAKKIDEAWRSKKTAPSCPHCLKAILPEDVLNGFASVSKEWELKRREHQAKTDR